MKFVSHMWSKGSQPFSASQLVLLFPLLLSLAGESVQDGTVVNANIRADTRTEKIKIGNSKTNTYNIQESNYVPTQLTQVVVNVPKKKKSRKNRPPTQEEFAIKRRILDVFAEAKKERISGSGYESESTPESTQHTDHLERILRALNPKYIATERVYRVAFADPSDPDPSTSLPELPEPPTPQADQTGQQIGQQQESHDERLKLDLEYAESIEEQLERVDEVIREHVEWTDSFIGRLANTSDEQLPAQLVAYKHLLLCLADESKCSMNSRVIKIFQQHHPPVSHSSESSSSSSPTLTPPTTPDTASSVIAQLSDSLATKLPPQALRQAKMAFDGVAMAQEKEPLTVSESNERPATFVRPPWQQANARASSWHPHSNWAPANQPQAPLVQSSASQMHQTQQMMPTDAGQLVFHDPQGEGQLVVNRFAPAKHQNQDQHQPAHTLQLPSLAEPSKGSGLRFKGQAQRLRSLLKEAQIRN